MANINRSLSCEFASGIDPRSSNPHHMAFCELLFLELWLAYGQICHCDLKSRFPRRIRRSANYRFRDYFLMSLKHAKTDQNP
ncbi:hypothetical protein ALC53_08249 [Atta colombica]|uniref:Uncharacterized protein n=1 Tax=Atta colombica TaxID=520822 RepID=A0A151I3B2_9HYME|nr:hypothetical protein ALC53_08249 [Atta colombica]